MDWKAAIAHIKTLEGAVDSINILEGEVNRLTNANFELVKDIRVITAKSKEAEGKLADLLQIVGAEGDDLKAQTDSASGKIKDLQSDLNKVSKEKGEIETKYTSLEEETTNLKRRTIITEAAAKTGAVADVLATLTKDISVDRILIDNDEIVIVSSDGKEKKPLKEYAEAEWHSFVPALFPSNNGQFGKTKLPSASPNSGQSKEESPLQTYRNATYNKTIEKLNNKAS